MILESKYYFALLGKSRELAWGELSHVVNEAVRFDDLLATVPADNNPNELVKRLGGTVKVFLPVSSAVSLSEAVNVIAADISQIHVDTIALSSYKADFSLADLGSLLKKQLKNEDVRIRFRILDSIYDSAGITTDWVEYAVIKTKEGYQIVRTAAVQDINYWTEKDYSRPGIDPRSGMMPPKIARMLTNLAVPQTTITPEIRFYDPFCGSGTLLVEALDLGMSVVGSDLSAKAVKDSTNNCAWFTEEFSPKGNYLVFESDATHVTLDDTSGLVDGIAFEGYLGPPNPKEEKFANLTKGLSKLYKGVFKAMNPLLKPGGHLVCALPVYKGLKSEYSLDKLIDEVPALGYTRLSSYSYARAHAVVGRKIYVLKKNEN